MLTRYRFELRPEGGQENLTAEGAYCLYAALLEQAPADFSSRVHTDGVTPVSQFAEVAGGRFFWNVSLLGEDSERALGELLDTQDCFRLNWNHSQLRVVSRQREHYADVDTLLQRARQDSGLQELRFLTPTCFKSRGQYQNLPTVRLLLQSLVKKWNGCITDCPIEDEDGAGLEALADGLVCKSHSLRSSGFRLKGNFIPGFTGYLRLENQLSGFQRELTTALLLFSAYAGVGIKTTLGMGGVSRLSI